MSAALKTVAELETQLKSAKQSLNELRAKRKIICHCGRRHAINTLTLLATHWYVQPYSCSSGDYYQSGEYQFVCPVTIERNRLLFDDYALDYGDRTKPEYSAEYAFKNMYGYLFKERISTYEDRHDCPYNKLKWHNNYDVDKRRKYFELPPKVKVGEKYVRAW